MKFCFYRFTVLDGLLYSDVMEKGTQAYGLLGTLTSRLFVHCLSHPVDERTVVSRRNQRVVKRREEVTVECSMVYALVANFALSPGAVDDFLPVMSLLCGKLSD